MTRRLYEFACPTCGPLETFADEGVKVVICPTCHGDANRKYSVPVKPGLSFGKVGVAHTPDRKLSPFERERREYAARKRQGLEK